MTPFDTMRIMLVVSLMAMALPCLGAESPKRISIAPTNNLSAFVPPDHVTIGGSTPAWKVSTAYKRGWGIGAINRIRGNKNILVIDDGRTDHNGSDKETGFPIIILIDAKLTRELQDLVQGYNFAMHQAWTRSVKTKHQNAEQAPPVNRSGTPVLEPPPSASGH